MKDRIVIGITGKKRAGKDTAASYFVNYHNFQKYAFADPVREACRAFFGWTNSQMSTNKEEVDPYWGVSPRQGMQYLGTEVGREGLPNFFENFDKITGGKIWIKRFEQEYHKSNNNFVVSDLRFPNEFDSVKNISSNSYVIGVVRNTGFDDTHASESFIDEIIPRCDFVIENNGSIQDFFEKVENITKEILGGE